MRPGWSAGDGGLIWGSFVLLLALGAFTLLFPEIREATREVPILSPATIESIELDEHHGTLVEVRGFDVDCDDLLLDNRRVLAPARASGHDSNVVVAFEYGSDCPALGEKFRGEARVRNWSGDVVVEPRRFPSWALAIVLGLAGLGLAGIASAFIHRKRLRATLQAGIAPRTEPPAPELADPYRPGQSDRLITEALRPSVAHLAKLRRKRILRASAAVVLLGTALGCALVGGQRIREREHTWQAGIDPIEEEVVGKSERVGLGLVHTELDVSYVDHRGRGHRERVTATSFRHEPNTAVTATVRYARDESERFAVSWVHEQFRGSLSLLAAICASLLGIAVARFIAVWRDRAYQQTMAVFEDPREALLDLLGVERQHPGADRDMVTYHFRVRDSARCCSVVVGRGQAGPLFLDRRETVALALYSPRERTGLLVLSEDLRELEQPPFTAAQLRGRYRGPADRANPPPPRRRRRRR